MTTAKQPVRQKITPDSYCGYCAGWRSVWCPDCGGFAGCVTCYRTCKVPCPDCSGGTREKFTRP